MNIKRLRMSRRLTQEELGNLLKIARTTVVMWENGKSKPKTKMLPKLAEALNCEISELFEE